jgi:hypothetical protein
VSGDQLTFVDAEAGQSGTLAAVDTSAAPAPAPDPCHGLRSTGTASPISAVIRRSSSTFETSSYTPSMTGLFSDRQVLDVDASGELGGALIQSAIPNRNRDCPKASNHNLHRGGLTRESFLRRGHM